MSHEQLADQATSSGRCESSTDLYRDDWVVALRRTRSAAPTTPTARRSGATGRSSTPVRWSCWRSTTRTGCCACGSTGTRRGAASSSCPPGCCDEPGEDPSRWRKRELRRGGRPRGRALDAPDLDVLLAGHLRRRSSTTTSPAACGTSTAATSCPQHEEADMEALWVPFADLLERGRGGPGRRRAAGDRGPDGARSGQGDDAAGPSGSLAPLPRWRGGDHIWEDHVKVGVPKEVKNHEYRVAITPVGVHELAARSRGLRRAGRGPRLADPRRGVRRAPARRSCRVADEVWGNADMVLKVKEPIAEEYHRLREGLTLFTYLHLAADKPLTEELIDAQGHRDRLRDGAAALRRAAAAVPDVGGRRLPGAPGGRLLDAEGPGRPRRPDGRRRRRRERQGRHHRGRRVGPERRQHRARHGRRRDPARHRPGQAADVVLALQQPGARAGLLEARHRAAGDARPTWSSARC